MAVAVAAPANNDNKKPTKKMKQTPEYPNEAEWLKKENDQLKSKIDTSRFKEITLDDVAKVLSDTIVDDDTNKKIVFIGMLSAYTDESQVNVSMNAPSSQGKTHIVQEVAKLFPKEDKIEIHSATPTSFFYEIDYIDKEHNVRYKDVRRKILIFYELPDPSLQLKLRPLLSHDAREIIHKQTNKSKGRNVTDTTVVRGHAAFFFCSANMKLDEQEATRAILLSPEITQEKLARSVHLRAIRSADEKKFNDWLESVFERVTLKDRIIAIRDEHIDEVIIKNPEAIEQRFLELVGTLIPRHQRDIAHLFELIRSVTILNVWFRRQPDGTVVANDSDVKQAFDLFDELFDSQNLNLPPAVHSFYKKYVVPAYVKLREKNINDQPKQCDFKDQKIGLTEKDLSTFYLMSEGTSLNGDTLRKNILPQLENSGLIVWQKPDKDVPYSSEKPDARFHHIFPQSFTKTEVEKFNYIGQGGMSEKKLKAEEDNMLDLLRGLDEIL
jgi:hypothetical protein